jgi:hypothetical protein
MACASCSVRQCPATHQPVVRVAAPGDTRVGPRHPGIERIVQEEIGQDGAGHSLNAKDNFAFERGIRLDRCACILDLRRKR